MYSFELGNHHCVVMHYFDAVAVAAGCIMGTFNYRNVCPISVHSLSVLEDRHAIIDNTYPIEEIGLERFLLGEASKINLEFTPINEYPELLYDATRHLTLGLISHHLHDCVNTAVNRDYISDIKSLAYTDEREDVRHAIIDAFEYCHTHMGLVYDINAWYYES